MQRAMNWSDVGVEANGERLHQCDPRKKIGKEVPPPPQPHQGCHSRLLKGLKSWVITIFHFFPSRHVTLMLTMSAAVSF